MLLTVINKYFDFLERVCFFFHFKQPTNCKYKLGFKIVLVKNQNLIDSTGVFSLTKNLHNHTKNRIFLNLNVLINIPKQLTTTKSKNVFVELTEYV